MPKTTGRCGDSPGPGSPLALGLHGADYHDGSGRARPDSAGNGKGFGHRTPDRRGTYSTTLGQSRQAFLCSLL